MTVLDAEPGPVASTDPTGWRRTDIDGVPVFWMPGRVAGRAGLTFRVGHADESLPTAGITSLCHQLIVHEQEPRVGGSVDVNRTTFEIDAPGDLAAEIRRICHLIRHPDLTMLEDVRALLSDLDAGRVLGAVDTVMQARYGPRGYGLGTYPDYGVNRVRGDNIAGWYAAWFTKVNAVLWFDGEVPDGLAIDLDPGELRPVPEIKDLPQPYPAHVTSPNPVMAVTTEAEYTPELAVALEVLRRRLTYNLHDREALAYAVEEEQLQLTEEIDHISMIVEMVATRGKEAVSAMLTVVHQLGDHGPEAPEVAEAKARVLERMSGREFEMSELVRAATDDLLGGAPTDLDEFRRRVQEADVAATHEAYRGALESLVYHVPASVEMPGDTSTLIPRWARVGVEGQTYEPAVDRREGQTLTVGKDGVTITHSGRRYETSLAKTCAALLKWADGGRRLIDATGLAVTIEPGEWVDGEEAVAQIDQVVPVRRHIEQGTRLGVPEVSPERRLLPTTTLQLRPILLIVLALVAVWGLWTALSTSTMTMLGAGFLAMLGAAAVGMALVKRIIAETRVGGRLERPEVYDAATGSLDDDPTSPMTRSHQYLPGGTLLAWAINRGLMSPEFVASSERDIGRVRARTMSGPELYQRWNGLLVSDMLDEEANEFFMDYLRLEPIVRASVDGRSGYAFSYKADFWELGSMPPVGGTYSASHAWNVYDRLTERLDAQLEKWQAQRRVLMVKRVLSLPPRFVSREPAPAPLARKRRSNPLAKLLARR